MLLKLEGKFIENGVVEMCMFKAKKLGYAESMKYYSGLTSKAHADLQTLMPVIKGIKESENTSARKEVLIRELIVNSEHESKELMLNMYLGQKNWAIDIIEKHSLVFETVKNEEGYSTTCIYSHTYVDMNGDTKSKVYNKPLFIDKQTKEQIRLVESEISDFTEKQQEVISEICTLWDNASSMKYCNKAEELKIEGLNKLKKMVQFGEYLSR